MIHSFQYYLCDLGVGENFFEKSSLLPHTPTSFKKTRKRISLGHAILGRGRLATPVCFAGRRGRRPLQVFFKLIAFLFNDCFT